MPMKKFEFITGQEVEVKTIEKRIEEIWYVGKIVGISEDKTKRNKYLVEYPISVKTPVADFIPYSRLRPKPPSSPQETKNLWFQLNQVVDAFYYDGWWKGVVSKIPCKGCPWYTVFFKDEQKAKGFRRSNVRAHFDWIHGKWVTSQNKETEVLTQNVGSLLTPNPTDGSACGNNMDVSHTPSEKMDSPSTPNRTKAEMTAIAHIDGTFLTPIQTGSSSCGIDMDISQTPSGVRQILMEDCPSEVLTSTILCHDQWQKKQHAGLPTTHIKDPSLCTEIKLHGTGSMGKQIEVFKRKRGRLIGSGREQEVAHKELTVTQMETTQLLSTPVQECIPLPPCIEKLNSPVENDNREVSSVNQLIPTEAIAQIDASLESRALLESSNAFDNLFLEEDTTSDAQILYEGISEDEGGTHSDGIAASTSLVQHAEEHLHDENLPFIKSSPLWGSFEGIKVLQLVPQHPHYRPLEQYDEEIREGYAIGNLVSFVKLAEDISKAKLEEPRSVFENRLKALAELEEHGFTVHPLRLRLEEYLRIKDSYTELNINSKTVEREFTEEKRKFDELEDSVSQLKIKLKTYMLDKEMIESSVADQQKKVAEFKEIMGSLKRDFDSVVSHPFV
ncbi:hypothetical protein FRX31_015750 [Thalictrum thalictroides]|uniref:Agenet domain-containing protein n=1 Tax=Thalictrum thalictroides TaxID=46969 RepID=A0A7J6WCQ4_THATH|nr:hypothetical protein FRX31_015750 [Thalictrum thalictroides]